MGLRRRWFPDLPAIIANGLDNSCLSLLQEAVGLSPVHLWPGGGGAVPGWSKPAMAGYPLAPAIVR